MTDAGTALLAGRVVAAIEAGIVAGGMVAVAARARCAAIAAEMGLDLPGALVRLAWEIAGLAPHGLGRAWGVSDGARLWRPAEAGEAGARALVALPLWHWGDDGLVADDVVAWAADRPDRPRSLTGLDWVGERVTWWPQAPERLRLCATPAAWHAERAAGRDAACLMPGASDAAQRRLLDAAEIVADDEAHAAAVAALLRRLRPALPKLLIAAPAAPRSTGPRRRAGAQAEAVA